MKHISEVVRKRIFFFLFLQRAIEWCKKLALRFLQLIMVSCTWILESQRPGLGFQKTVKFKRGSRRLGESRILPFYTPYLAALLLAVLCSLLFPLILLAKDRNNRTCSGNVSCTPGITKIWRLFLTKCLVTITQSRFQKFSVLAYTGVSL